MDNELDIRDFEAKFHCKSMFPRIYMAYPSGEPLWGAKEHRIIFDFFMNSGSNYSEEVVSSLEKKVAGMFNVKHALALGSGREAICLGLKSLGLKPGDGVILPDYCCQSVLAPVLSLGLRPVFADIDERLQINPQSVARVVCSGVKALIIPHLYGRLADMDRLSAIARKHGLHVIDDAAQAIGLRHVSGFAGTCGDCGIFSFGLFKPLSAMGGGMLLTDNDALFANASQFMSNAQRMHHSRSNVLKIWMKIFHRNWSYGLFLLNRMNSRTPSRAINHNRPQPMEPRKMSLLDARLVNTMLDQLHSLRSRLIDPADRLRKGLAKVPWLQQEIDNDYIGYPRWQIGLREDEYSSEKFKKIFASLLRQGIEVQAGYLPLHQLMIERGLPVEGEFEKSRFLHNRILCLPLSPTGNIDPLLRIFQQFPLG